MKCKSRAAQAVFSMVLLLCGAAQAVELKVLNPPVLDALIKQGLVVADTRAVIGRIGLGAAVRAGVLRPIGIQPFVE